MLLYAIAVNWIAVSAVATIGYLFASLFLWSAAWKAAKAAEKQAQLTADAVRTANQQAEIANQQFQLSQDMFLAEMQPVLCFPEWSLTRRSDGYLECRVVVKNDGKLTASNVRWSVSALGDNNLMGQPSPSASSEASELQPQEDLPVSSTIGPPEIKNGSSVTAQVEVHYTTPADATNKRVSVCRLKYDCHTHVVSKTTRTHYLDSRTATRQS